MKPLFLLAGAAAIFLALAPAVWSASADEPPKSYSIRIVGLSNDGVMIPATPTSTPTPISISPPMFGSKVEQWRILVSGVFTGQAVTEALHIIECESGGDPNATGRAGERGLMQIHPVHHDSTYDPVGNLRAAYRISNGGTNWSAWSCYPW